MSQGQQIHVPNTLSFQDISANNTATESEIHTFKKEHFSSYAWILKA